MSIDEIEKGDILNSNVDGRLYRVEDIEEHLSCFSATCLSDGRVRLFGEKANIQHFDGLTVEDIGRLNNKYGKENDK